MKRIFTCLFLALVLVPATGLAEKVYRWVDNEGKVHFGRTLPPEYSNKPYLIMNENGVVLERVDDPLARSKPKVAEKKDDKLAPLFTADEVRFRTDRLLVLKYQSVADIQEAMELEIAQLAYDERLTERSQSSTMQAMTGHVRTAADRQRAGLPVDEELEKTINSLRNRMRRSENSISELKEREITIRAAFNEQIQRYEFLQNGGRPGETVTEPETSDTDS